MTSPVQKATELTLQTSWHLYWHARDNKSWDLASYKEKATITNVAEFWRIYNNLRTVAFDMFFLMRANHPPLWEAPNNVHGGALSFRIHNKEVDNFWLIASLLLIGETICSCPEEIVGLSVSPKLKNTTIRIWYRDEKRLDAITKSLHHELLRISDDYIVRKHSDQ
jgi:hypothetical protein